MDPKQCYKGTALYLVMQIATNKGTDQTVQMHRLIYTFIVGQEVGNTKLHTYLEAWFICNFVECEMIALKVL